MNSTHTLVLSHSVVISNVGVLRIAAAAFDRNTYIPFSHQFFSLDFLRSLFSVILSFLFVFLSVFIRFWHLVHIHIRWRDSDMDIYKFKLNAPLYPNSGVGVDVLLSMPACLHNGFSMIYEMIFLYIVWTRFQLTAFDYSYHCRHLCWNSNTPSLNSI